MAKKGDQARQSVMNTIVTAFGDAYVTTQDKKIYVMANDGPGGETLQFAISITMPKNPVAATTATSSSLDGGAWDSGSSNATSNLAPPQVTLSDADKAAVDKLMKDLGL